MDVATLALAEGGHWGYLHHQIPSAFSYYQRSRGKEVMLMTEDYAGSFFKPRKRKGLMWRWLSENWFLVFFLSPL